VVVSEALPDGDGGDRRVCLDHLVDVAVQAFQGVGSWRIFWRSGGSA
jgi:hypothetical protein